MRSDLELIQLVRECSADELSPADVQELRARWSHSAELRHALIEHLQFESSLAQVLGEIDLTVDAILQRAEQNSQLPNAQRRTGWWIALGLSLLFGVSLGGWWITRPKLDAEKIAANSPADPSKETGSNTATDPDKHPANQVAKNDGLGTNAVPSDGAATNAVKSANTTEPPAAAPVEPATPWAATLLADDAEVLPTNSPKLAADLKSIGHDHFSEEEFRRWFREVPGHSFNTAQDLIGNKRIARFQGLAALKAPWKIDALWRLTPFDVDSLTLYFWKGNRGIALKWYPHSQPQMWAAYHIERDDQKPRPKRWGLLTTDNGADFRTTPSTVDLHWQSGLLVLAQGNIPFLQAPFADLPDEVYIEGKFRLRGCSLLRSDPLPIVVDDPRPVIFGGDRPLAQQPWHIAEKVAGELAMQSSGAVEFHGRLAEQASMAYFPLPPLGSLTEIIVQVSHAEPGTGWFLGDADGKPLTQVAYFKEKRTGWTSFGHLPPGDGRTESELDPAQIPTVYAAPKHWIKLVVGWGQGRLFVSGDGKQFGGFPADNPIRDIRQPFFSFGLIAQKGANPRKIRIESVQVRKLSGIVDQTTPELIAKAPDWTADELKSPPLWWARVMQQRPAEVSPRDWLHACAVTTLNANPPRDVAYQLLKGLIADAVAEPQPLERRLRLLDEATWLMDLWEDGGKFAQWSEKLAAQFARDSQLPEQFAVRSAFIRSALWSNAAVTNLFDRTDAQQLLTFVFRGDWDRVMELTDRLQFTLHSPHPDYRPREFGEELDKIASWARRTAAEMRPQARSSNERVLPTLWRNPWLTQLSKEGYNARAELQAALSGGSFEDACRVVSSLAVSDSSELLPDIDDKDLFVSLRTSVASAMRNSSDFQRVMTTQFGPQGLIRVRQAMAEGDATAVRAATLQFFGTGAAVEAHRWWGDRALAAGEYSEANEQYLLGAKWASASQLAELRPRFKVAGALSGRLTPTNAETTLEAVELGGATLSANDLQEWVRISTAKKTPRATPHPLVGEGLPAPHGYRMEVRANFDGQSGQNVGSAAYRLIDWVGQQLAVAADDKFLYVHNHFQTNAYERDTLKQRWAEAVGKDQGDAHAFSGIAMTPLPVGARVYVRRLTQLGVELAALDRETGRVLWKFRPQGKSGGHVLSDPLVIDGDIAVLITERSDNEGCELSWGIVDAVTGQLRKSQLLTRFRDAWNGQLPVQLAYHDHDVVATAGTATLCFSDTGTLRWIRRHGWLPQPIDDLRYQQHPGPPVIRGSQVFLSLSGLRGVCCVELETGKLVWQQPVPTITGLLAVKGERVIVKTATGISALEAKTGQPVWSFTTGPRGMQAFAANEQHVVLGLSIPPQYQKDPPALVWVNLQTGIAEQTGLTTGYDEKDPCFGPVFQLGSRWLVFRGKSWKDPPRELCELIPQKPAAVGPPMNSHWPGWTADFYGMDYHQSELNAALDGWQSILDLRKKIQFPVGMVREEANVVQIKLDRPPTPVVLARQLEIPREGPATLAVRLGNLPGQSWTAILKVEEQILLTEELSDETTSQGWKSWSLDVSKWAGKTVTAIFVMQSSSLKEADALVRELRFNVTGNERQP